MYSRPSVSQRREPFARSMISGAPPTARNARTGLFTPPTRIFPARAAMADDREELLAAAVFSELRDMALIVRQEPSDLRTGATYSLISSTDAPARTTIHEVPTVRDRRIRRRAPSWWRSRLGHRETFRSRDSRQPLWLGIRTLFSSCRISVHFTRR